MDFKMANSLRYHSVCFFLLICFSANTQTPLEKIAGIQESMANLNRTEKMQAYLDLALHYQELSNKSDSVKHFANKVLEMAKSDGIAELEHAALYRLGMDSWYGDEDFDAAKNYFNQSKDIINRIGDSEKLPKVNNAIGSINLIQGDFEQALIYYQDAFEGARDSEDFELMAMAGTNMSIIYVKNGDTTQSIKINEESLEYLNKEKDSSMDMTQIGVLINLGDLYKKTKQYDKATRLVKKARSIVDTLGSFRQEGRLSILEARLLDELGKEEQLFQFVESKIEQLPKTSGYDREIYTSMLIYRGRAMIARNDLNGAKAVSNELEQYLGKSNVKHQKNLLKSLYELNEKIGNYQKAFKYRDRFSSLSDSLLNTSLQNKLIAAESEFQLSQKELEIEQGKIANLELSKRNNRLLLGVLGLLLLGLAYYFYQYQNRQKQKEEIKQIEQKILTLQMNPHFIFNSISSIQNFLFDEGDKKKAIQHLSTFASLMRQMLEHSRERFIPLDEELSFLKDYLALQKLRYDNKFNYKIEIDPEVNIYELSIPPLLTQPFIENAIEHGKIHTVENGELIVNISKQGDQLKITISDNGVGFNQTTNSHKEGLLKKQSLSIKITTERLKLLTSLMKKKWDLEIKENKPNKGVSIQLGIPVILLT